MSRNILVICNTFSQLLITLQMRISIFESDSVSIIITDKSPVNDSTITRIKYLNCFKEVFYIHSSDYCAGKTSIKLKIYDVRDIANGKSIINSSDINYELLLYYNLDMTALALFGSLYNKNKNIECARYEEGILSYNNPVNLCAKFKFGNFLRTISGKETIIKKTRSFYCSYPKFYRGNLRTIEIPRISANSSIGETLKYIFNLKDRDLNYKEKYIYFSSVYDFEGGQPIGELNLVKKIRDHVGNDNLLVKVHPRDKRTIYDDEGFHVDHNSRIPWEAIQLNLDCTDKVFITTNSGSVLFINMLIDKMPKTIFTYKCCNYICNQGARITIDNLEILLHDDEYKQYFTNIRVLERINEL